LQPPETFAVRVRTAHPAPTMFSHEREIEATENTPEAPEVGKGAGTPQLQQPPGTPLHPSSSIFLLPAKVRAAGLARRLGGG